jgi:DNA-directed DNA polymerase III PolC
MTYVPLRVHGWHSLLTGVDSPGALLARGAKLGLEALALTDVDTLSGLVDFLRAAERLGGPRPIVGAELTDPTGAPGRVVALVRDAAGYRNLCRLVSARRLGDDPGDPEAYADPERTLRGPEDFDLVLDATRFREGLTLLVDHPRLVFALAGRVPREQLFVGLSPAGARRRARIPGSEGRWRETEVSDDGGLEDPKVPPPARAAAALDLLRAARATGLATLALPDVYAATTAGRGHHRVRTAIKHNALVEDLPESWLAEPPLHLLAADELRAAFADVAAPRDVERMLGRTRELAEDCRFTPPLGGVLFPEVELAADETPYSRLCNLAFTGAALRYRPLRPEVVRRLDRELTAIDELGYAPYFLLVKRIANFARERGIPCVGRGSAADSLVAYCLDLTDADPLRYRLPFERFLNPARKDRPDIDLDFCWRRRDEVIEHVWDAFGPERTAMISTLGCFGLRSAFREAALAAGVPPVEVNHWSRRLPWAVSNAGSEATGFDGTVQQADDGPEEPVADVAEDERPLLATLPDGLARNSLARAFASTPECRDFPFDDPRLARVLHVAAALVDAPRHLGLHPGGVVVAPGAITDVLPCQRAAKGVVVTQLDKDGVEALGLVKMDLLGNRALTVIDDCLRALRAREVEVDPYGAPEDDPATARTLAEGRTLGCFQVESPGMRNLLQQIAAGTMDDVIQSVALIRPGPASSGMKDAFVRRFRGHEPPTPPHALLTELLHDTHGVMLYQEDVMQAAVAMAGMDLAQADVLRRALAKRRQGELHELERRFHAGCHARGVERADAARVWELISNFASFGFCKAHAVTYGRIAWRTVYLKTHHPAAYLAAFLESRTGYYETRVYVEEARRLGVPILPPDVNRSAVGFSLEWEDARPALRVGLDRVKGLTERTRDALVAERAVRPFLSLPDLLTRTGARTDELEHLIQCGACDAFDRTRPEMMWRLHLLVTPARRPPRDADAPALDPGLLAACRGTPEQRARQAATGGWAEAGLGLGSSALERGDTAALFPEPETPALALPRLPELDAATRGRLELTLLGLTVARHPTTLFPCEGEERARESAAGGGERPPRTIACRELTSFVGLRVSLRGWLAASRRVRTADARWMRFLTLEDETGLAEVVLFADAYERWGGRLTNRGPFLVSGTVEDQLGARTLHAERIW